MPTDVKEEARVKRLHGAIVSGEYDEDDVQNLFITLRDHSPYNSVVREFAHFVAHRDKDRGPLFDYVTKRMAELREQLATNSADLDLSKPVHTVAELQASLDQALGIFGCIPFSEDRTNEIAAALVSLLQHVRLSGGLGDLAVHVSQGHYGRMIAVAPTYIQLMGRCPFSHQGKDVSIVFRVFAAENRGYFKYEGTPYRFTGVAKASCAGGKFTIVDELT